MNDLQIFNNEKFGEIRTITKDDKTYFAGSDVAKALGYAIPHKAVQTHCKGVLKWNMPKEEAETLDNYCTAKNCSKAGFIRQAIKEKMEREP